MMIDWVNRVTWVGIVAGWSLISVACWQSPTSARQQNTTQATGNQQQRVAWVERLMRLQMQPPSPIIDAQFLEEQKGSGTFGPADYFAFWYIRVSPDDIDAWQSVLTPLAQTSQYTMPTVDCKWWLTEQRFGSLEFFQPMLLTGRINGWVGINVDAGEIYIHTFTQ